MGRSVPEWADNLQAADSQLAVDVLELSGNWRAAIRQIGSDAIRNQEDEIVGKMHESLNDGETDLDKALAKAGVERQSPSYEALKGALQEHWNQALDKRRLAYDKANFVCKLEGEAAFKVDRPFIDQVRTVHGDASSFEATDVNILARQKAVQKVLTTSVRGVFRWANEDYLEGNKMKVFDKILSASKSTLDRFERAGILRMGSLLLALKLGENLFWPDVEAALCQLGSCSKTGGSCYISNAGQQPPFETSIMCVGPDAISSSAMNNMCKCAAGLQGPCSKESATTCTVDTGAIWALCKNPSCGGCSALPADLTKAVCGNGWNYSFSGPADPASGLNDMGVGLKSLMGNVNWIFSHMGLFVMLAFSLSVLGFLGKIFSNFSS